MPDRFVPLEEFVMQPPGAEPEVLDPATPIQTEEPRSVDPQTWEALAEVRRFRASVYDAVDVAVRAVLFDVAAEVLARELELAPANLEAIVARACARHASEGIVCIRIHPDEAEQLRGAGVEVVEDSGVRRGDALLHVRSGTIDVTLGARLAGVLDGLAL